MSSPQWYPPRSKGKGVGACSEMQVVSGKASCFPRLVKEALVSPRPCRRMSAFIGWVDNEGGGVMVSWMLEGKSLVVGWWPGMFSYCWCFDSRPERNRII